MEYLKSEYNQKHKVPDDYYGKNRKEILQFVPDTLKEVLDVGCSKGYFGHLLKNEKNLLVWGIEPDEISAREASGYLDKVINGTFEEALEQLGDKKFDCIVFNDVLEHFAYPNLVLKSCRKLLNPNGYIIGSLPNVRDYYVLQNLLLEKDWEYVEEGVMDKTHLRFFTQRSIVRMFEEAGFRINKIEGINPHDETKFGKIYKFVKLIKPAFVTDVKFLQFGFCAQLTSD